VSLRSCFKFYTASNRQVPYILIPIYLFFLKPGLENVIIIEIIALFRCCHVISFDRLCDESARLEVFEPVKFDIFFAEFFEKKATSWLQLIDDALRSKLSKQT